jgi:hypothetical protein
MSINFSTKTHDILNPDEMPLQDRILDRSKYRYDSNWAFCRFDDPEIIGARFGFGRGLMLASDFGFSEDTPGMKPSTGLRIEILTTKGAYLFIDYDKYPDEALIFDNQFHHCLVDGNQEMIHMEGFPEIRWKMASADGFAMIDFVLSPFKIITLPDNILRKSTFSMWMAICLAKGKITLDGQEKDLSGSIFFDHPRISAEEHDVKDFGSYLYTPIRLSDGSHFVGYYSDFLDGERNDDYSFGYYIDKDSNVSVYKGTSLTNLHFSVEWQVKTFDVTFENKNSEIRFSGKEENYPVLRTWGTGNNHLIKKDNRVFPQPFTVEFVRTVNGIPTHLTGCGVTEYIQNNNKSFER